ncbi:hypothetical protein K438DRAFT_2000204 [Mycena galopus ATCC 62051]|nr:hypothetical protein K438DRAFT_2000204 [Mycena galopus ATCC 62051]
MAMAPLNQQGHPMFPRSLADNVDAKLGAHAGLVMPTRYAENEGQRHTQALATIERTPLPRTSMELTRDWMGPWASAREIAMFNKAVNLCRWVLHGDAQSMLYLKWAITQLHDPAIRRSIGGVTLLQYQNQVLARYKLVTEGPRVPRTKVTNAGHRERDDMMAALDGNEQRQHESVLMPEDVPMPPAGDGHASSPAYLGVAIGRTNIASCVHLTEAPVQGVPGRDITTASMEEAIGWYRDILTSLWPIGMRISPTTVASLTTVSAEPIAPDVAAWLTINALAPPHGGTAPSHRGIFLGKMILIFSVPGYFDHYTTIGEYPHNNLPLEQYPFETKELRWCHVVSWFIQHGLTVGSDAVRAIESFACSRRNSFLRNTDLQNQTFTDDWPRKASGLEFTVLGATDMWASLTHGPIHPGIETFYPNAPAARLEVDVDDDRNISVPPATPSAESTSTTTTEG